MTVQHYKQAIEAHQYEPLYIPTVLDLPPNAMTHSLARRAGIWTQESQKGAGKRNT